MLLFSDTMHIYHEKIKNLRIKLEDIKAYGSSALAKHSFPLPTIWLHEFTNMPLVFTENV
jgi:hypothetical protein